VSPRKLSNVLLRDVPLLTDTATIESGVREVVASGLPALPVIDERERLCGLFGEREFMTALFPRYVSELSYAAFVPPTLDVALEKRAACRSELVREHMNTEHVDVPRDFSDVQVAETFLHHRVLIIPVTDDGRVFGAITRSDFFRSLAERFLGNTSD